MSYVNRHGKPFSKELVRLARLSPEGYGKLIVERNSALLKLLDAGTPDTLQLGCPHCRMGICWQCLWTEVYGNDEHQCCGALFPSGYRYRDMKMQTVKVIYGSNLCRLELRPPLRQSEVDAARAFLEDHVDWGNLPCWGVRVGSMAWLHGLLKNCVDYLKRS